MVAAEGLPDKQLSVAFTCFHHFRHILQRVVKSVKNNHWDTRLKVDGLWDCEEAVWNRTGLAHSRKTRSSLSSKTLVALIGQTDVTDSWSVTIGALKIYRRFHVIVGGMVQYADSGWSHDRSCMPVVTDADHNP